MEQLVSNLLGANPQEQDQAKQFVQRYQQGKPTEGFSDQEAQQHYQRVAKQAPPDVYRKAAEEAFARLSPQERQEYVQDVKRQAKGHNAPRVQNWNEHDNSPQQLADMTTHMHQNQPEMMNQLVSSVAGGNPIMKAALGGIAAMAMKQMTGGH